MIKKIKSIINHLSNKSQLNENTTEDGYQKYSCLFIKKRSLELNAIKESLNLLWDIHDQKHSYHRTKLLDVYHGIYRDLYEFENEGVLRIRKGDKVAIEAGICWLEADPYCFRSGYLLKKIAKAFARYPQHLSKKQKKRLQDVILKRINSLNHKSWRYYDRIALNIQDNKFMNKVRKISKSTNTIHSQRAQNILDYIQNH